MRRNSLAIAITLVFAQPAFAADPAASSTPRKLQSVVVVASRVEQPVGEIAGSVALIERERIETRLIRDIRDLARYDASLSVNEDASRFGAQGFAIRGLEGNRVAVELDGVPLGDGFSVGSFSRRAQPGRSGVAGAGRVPARPGIEPVRIGRTRGCGRHAYPRSRRSARRRQRRRLRRIAHHPRFARRLDRGERFDRDRARRLADAAEREPAPGARARQPARSGGLQSNPAEGDERFVLAKLIHDDIVPGRLSFGFDGYRAEVETDVRSLVNGPGQYASTTAMRADDRESRGRASLAWSGESGGSVFRSWNLMGYVQRSEIEQDTLQDRRGATPSAAATRRLREFRFDTQQVGLEGLVAGEAQSGALAHRYVLGFDFARTALEESRNGSETNLATGVSLPVILGERLPVRDFPNSTVQELGVYAQDEIGFGERWFLIPALRLDRYRTDADPDAMWLADNPSTAVVDSTEHSVTPKLGLRYAASESLGLFAQYARGFRAPPFSDVNIGLNIPAFGYSAIPNPDLRPERSHGFEIGARWSGEQANAEIALYDNRYRDLIESRVNLGRDPQSGLLVFQSQNRDRARIHGIELSGDASLAAVGLDAYSTTWSASWSKGEDTQRNLPLNTIDPARLVLGLARDSGDGRHRVELLGRFAAGKDDLDTSAARCSRRRATACSICSGTLMRPTGCASMPASATSATVATGSGARCADSRRTRASRPGDAVRAIVHGLVPDRG
ncbi:MAG: TonB-dependent receptor [Xanthomonadales bacterium]|nr:TonB-dependent receptor [Xanthomonadales bacterium]